MTTYVQPQRRRAFRVGAILVGVMGATVLTTGEWLIAAVFGVAALVCVAVARSQVETTSNGVVLRNPFRRRVLLWEEIVDARLDRIPEIHLTDGTSVRAEGIEPFPTWFPTRGSTAIAEAFLAEVNGRA